MTDSAKRATAVLKTDARGRVRSTPAQRQAVLEEFERSGLSGPQFSRVAGIPYQTFAAWRRRRHKSSAQSSSVAMTTAGTSSGARQVRLVEAVMAAPSTSGAATHVAFRIELPGGSSVVVSHPAQVTVVAELIKAIAARSC